MQDLFLYCENFFDSCVNSICDSEGGKQYSSMLVENERDLYLCYFWELF